MSAANPNPHLTATQNQTVEPILLSIDAVCRATSLSRSAVYAAVNSGLLHRVHIGRRALITAESVRALAAA